MKTPGQLARLAAAALAITLLALGCSPTKRGLSIYFTDVEGGASTLIVTPAGESILIDTGRPGERDPGRIHDTATELAGLERIDHCIITHWHVDHVGGAAPLAGRFPVDHWYDRGLPPSPRDGGTDPASVEAYMAVTAGRSKVVEAGDEIGLRQLPGAPPVSLRCVVANGRTEGTAAEDHRECSEHRLRSPDLSDNAKSLGFIIRFGEFEFLDLGDITWNVEHDLVCPTNRLGEVDVYQVTHHGIGQSNNPLLLQAISPRVAIMNNGHRKGCAKRVVESLWALEETALFQLHRNVKPGALNTLPENIANHEFPCQGEPISVHVAADANAYEVHLGREGTRKRFQTK